MLVTFRTKAHGDITMFGNVAVELLKLAGHSGTVPTAILAKDSAAYAQRLESGLRMLGAASAPQPSKPGAATPGADRKRDRGDAPDAEPPVPLATRALPLLDLLRAAAASGADVLVTASGK